MSRQRGYHFREHDRYTSGRKNDPVWNARMGIFMGIRPSLLTYAYDYYLDPVAGDDTATGKRPWKAWKTWSKASSTLPSGAKIGIKRGSVLRETLTIPQGGLTIGAYHSGADDPRITGADIVSGTYSAVPDTPGAFAGTGNITNMPFELSTTGATSAVGTYAIVASAANAGSMGCEIGTGKNYFTVAVDNTAHNQVAYRLMFKGNDYDVPASQEWVGHKIMMFEKGATQISWSIQRTNAANTCVLATQGGFPWATTAVAMSAWNILEILITTSTGKMEAYLNSTYKGSYAGSAGLPAALSYIKFGLPNSNLTGQTGTFFMDEFAVDGDSGLIGSNTHHSTAAAVSYPDTYQITWATAPAFVLEEGEPLASQTTIADVQAGSGRFLHSGGVLYIRPNTVVNPVSATIEAAVRNNLFNTLTLAGTSFNGLLWDCCNQIALNMDSGANSTRFADMKVAFTNWYGMRTPDTAKINNLSWDGVTFRRAGIAGGFFPINMHGNNLEVLRCSFSENRALIDLRDVTSSHCSGVQIISNYFSSGLVSSVTNGGIVFDGDTNGVFSTGDVHTDVVVLANRFHNLYGRILDGALERGVWAYNLFTGSYGTGAHFIVLEYNGNSGLIVGNTADLDKAAMGMMINADPHAIVLTKQSKVLNNIFRLGSVTQMTYVATDPSLQPAFSANVYWAGAAGASQYHHSGKLVNLSQWQALGFDTTAREIDPLLGSTWRPAASSLVLSGGTSAVGSYVSNYDGQNLSADAAWAVGARKAA